MQELSRTDDYHSADRKGLPTTRQRLMQDALEFTELRPHFEDLSRSAQHPGYDPGMQPGNRGLRREAGTLSWRCGHNIGLVVAPTYALPDRYKSSVFTD